MAKNIALFIDGTANLDLGDGIPWNSNVVKLFYACTKSAFQKTHYMQGVGNDSYVVRPVSRLFGGAFGLGTGNRIREAYQFLSTHYDFGDRIYLFGFSRGALAARSLAGFVDAVGLLFKEETKLKKVKEAYRLYEKGIDPAQSELKYYLRQLKLQSAPSAENRTLLPIYFIGVWDTVVALGISDDWPKWAVDRVANYTRHHQADLPANVTYARHALSLHEIRQQFEPLLWKGRSPLNSDQSLLQVWFPGAHADVGGGYKETGWSDLALHWMASEAENCDLKLDWSKLPVPSEMCKENIHHEFKGIFGMKPPPAVRKDLVNRRSLALNTITTFSIHGSAFKRFLDEKTRRYQFQQTAFQMQNGININKTLHEADETSLQLYLDLCFRPSPPFTCAQQGEVGAVTKEWWAKARVADVALARTTIEQFLADIDDPTEETRDKFRLSLCLQVLCDDPKLASVIYENVMQNNRAKLSSLSNRKESMKAFRPWLVRLQVIAEEIDKCESMLPLAWRPTVKAIGMAVVEELRQLRFRVNLATLDQNRLKASIRRSPPSSK